MSSRPRLYPSDLAIGDVLEPPDTVAPLITPCINNDFDRLRAMLTEIKWATIALATPQRIYDTMDNAGLEAALRGHALVVRTLLAFGNEHDIPYDKLVHRSSVEAALRNGSKPVFEQLVNAVPEAVNQDLSLNGSPLYWAVSKNNIDLVEFLLQHGADANISHASGGKGYDVSLLSLAAHQNSAGVTEMLLKHGAELPQSGAFQVAAEYGFVDVLETLASYGANVNERLSAESIYRRPKELLASQSPLHFAAGKGQVAATA